MATLTCHRALAMPAGDMLIHAATYIRKLGCGMRRALLDRMNIQLAFATQSLALQPQRCWHLGLIVHELVVHAARHARARAGRIKIKLTRTGALVNCVILDNGSRPSRDTSDRDLRIARDIARALGGRIEQGFGDEFTSIVLSFPLTERERGANWSIATRQMRAPRRTRATASNEAVLTGSAATGQRGPTVETDSFAGRLRQQERELVVPRQSADVLGGLLSPSQYMDAP